MTLAIALDAMGGDHAPQVVVAGADMARQRNPELHFLMFGDEQQLYGSVSASDISDALSAQGVEIDKHAIQLDAPLKELGAFDVAIKIHADLAPSIKVWVVEE